MTMIKNRKIQLTLMCIISLLAGFSLNAAFFAPSLKEQVRSKIQGPATKTNNIVQRSATQQPKTSNKVKLSKVSSNKADTQVSSHQPSDFKNEARHLVSKEENLLNDARLRVAIIQWASQDPVSAMAFTIEHQKYRASELVLTVAAQQQNQVLLSWLSNKSQHQHYETWLSSYFKHFAAINTATALQLAQNKLQGRHKDIATQAVIQVWVKTDINAALNWLHEHDYSSSQPSLYKLALESHIKQAPWEASIELMLMDEGEDKNQLINLLAKTLSEHDAYDAIEWSETLAQHHQQEAMSNILTTWASSNSAQNALDFIISRKDLQNSPETFEATIAALADKDRNLLIERLDEFPEAKQDEVIQQVSRAISTYGDEREYNTWFNSLPMGSQRAAASLTAVEATFSKNPEAAFTLAENIINPQERAKYISKVARVWAATDEAQAKYAVMMSQTLTEAQKQQIIESI
ncbi:hypothetical protein [Agaribacterium sp. ZY112]|uniref:hypothetical protein n=1 Tax=Agaribacterium sp. ZY112 TaxID=3233574 RepID=UPI0035252389